ncbi:MAG: OsmC family peroxiredoxin, partial [bacterium]
MKRSSTAIWSGTGKEGKGTLSTQSGVFKNQPYNYVSRFEGGTDTNPEELVAAAHAGCFAMKLSFVLGNFKFVPDELNVT